MARNTSKYSRSLKVTMFAVGLLTGLAVVRFSVPKVSQEVAAIIIALACFAAVRNPIEAVCLAAGLGIGWWRGALVYQQVRPLQQLYGHKIIVRGTATLDGVYGTKGDLTFRLQVSEIIAPLPQSVNALIKVSGYGERSILRQDDVLVSGTLRPARGAAIGSMSFATITAASRTDSVLERLRLYFGAGLQSSLPEPHGSLGLGLLIGQRTTMPQAFQEQLTTVGLVHIVAVSGYNLTILVTAARKVLGKLSKYQSLLASLLLIGIFLAISGLAASLVRAALISVLSLGAGYYGRRIKPLVLLLVAAAATAMITPHYLWFDLGWYLSFAAFAGVILVAPAIKAVFYGNSEPKFLGGLLVETISAQLTTLPLILYLFGRLSIISLPANIAIVPLLPLTMLASVVSGVFGVWFNGWIAGLISLPAKWLLGYIIEATSLFSAVPFAEITFYINGYTLVGLYVILSCIVLMASRRATYAS